MSSLNEKPEAIRLIIDNGDKILSDQVIETIGGQELPNPFEWKGKELPDFIKDVRGTVKKVETNGLKDVFTITIENIQ